VSKFILVLPGSTMSCDSPLRSSVDNDIMSTALSGFQTSGKCLSSHFVFNNESVGLIGMNIIWSHFIVR